MDVSPAAPSSSAASSSQSAGNGPAAASGSAVGGFLPGMNVGLDGLLRRSASTEWRDWEETLDAMGGFGTHAGATVGLVGGEAAFEMDLGGFDHFLLATADDFLEPFAGPNAAPDSPIFAADQDFYYEREQDLSMLEAAGLDTKLYSGEDDALQSPMECKLEPLPLQQHQRGNLAVTRHRKRKTVELHRLRDEAERLAGENTQLEKKIKISQMHEQPNVQGKSEHKAEIASLRSEIQANEQTEKMYRRRYDILHEILEAWNTGGIEDMEEIADNVYDDDVTLISPDYSDGLRGVEAVMSHWNLLLDAFPDGIMEEYDIQREEGEKMKATWVFSGTQIYPIFGVEPRHEKVCISGKSFFTFKGDKIQQLVLTWNYREALLKLMGVQPNKSNGVVLSATVAGASSDFTGMLMGATQAAAVHR
ncbi:hypothetical protein BBJ28_00008868 [Nothophytophthora sp. Chile5]|nr:hypothetical protein BBJ28_00008868 [Nothophytophthora sp. Chile5]